MSIVEVLEEKLLGNFYSRVSLGDTFDLYFGRFWLISHNVVCPDEGALNEMISAYHPTNEAIDKDDIAKGTIITASLRKKITSVFIHSDSSLELGLENGVKLKFTTDTDVVDWQWAITENAQDPYHGFIVGVLSSGEVQLGNC
ncbi:hypothetical protein ACJJIU_03900 [Microbulbifer sp. CnH-101-E]|uniref:hypothetical protein n=1 Tax=unclassified Microbulbifer TaxID=2619833 RepID=UPI004039505C